MTLEQLKLLKTDDFATNNSEIWKSINNLPLQELEQLCELNLWSCDDIYDSLDEILLEKREQVLAQVLKTRLTEEEMTLFKTVTMQDRNITWNFLKHYLY